MFKGKEIGTEKWLTGEVVIHNGRFYFVTENGLVEADGSTIEKMEEE